MYSAQTIADWFVAWASAEDADLSNLKLQKLLYYAQGHHLGRTGEPLFSDAIQAWSHGPVVVGVYHRFKETGSGDITANDEFEWDKVDDETTQLLIEVWEAYGKFGAWQLRNMTHREDPWRNHFKPDEKYITIPTVELREYFAGR